MWVGFMQQKRDLVTKFFVRQTCKQGSICDFQGIKTLDFIWTHIILRLSLGYSDSEWSHAGLKMWSVLRAGQHDIDFRYEYIPSEIQKQKRGSSAAGKPKLYCWEMIPNPTGIHFIPV